MSHRQLWLLTLLGVAPVCAQPNAAQILDKYAQALGGQEAYEKVTTRVMKGTVEIPDDNVSGPAQALAKAPGSYRLTMDIPGYGVVETVLDGDNGWEANPDSGAHAMSKTDIAIAKRDHNFYRETQLQKLYQKLETAAPDKVNGRAVNVIEATPGSGPVEKFYFDAETGLLVKHDYERVTLEDGIVQYEVLYKDYREVDGLKYPATIEQRAPDNTMIFRFTEIKNNAALEDTAFAKPGK